MSMLLLVQIGLEFFSVSDLLSICRYVIELLCISVLTNRYTRLANKVKWKRHIYVILKMKRWLS